MIRSVLHASRARGGRASAAAAEDGDVAGGGGEGGDGGGSSGAAQPGAGCRVARDEASTVGATRRSDGVRALRARVAAAAT